MGRKKKGGSNKKKGSPKTGPNPNARNDECENAGVQNSIEKTNANPDGLAQKVEGNKHFMTGDYRGAIGFYMASVALFDGSNADDQEELSKVWANCSQCHLYLNQHKEALHAATESLKHNSSNLKALFRSAKAKYGLRDYHGAMEDALASGTSEGDAFAEKAKIRYDIYGKIIDSYRLRVEDEYTHTGDVDTDALYSGENPEPTRHFRAYVKMGLARGAFPKWFSSEDVDPITSMALSDKWYCIKYAVEASDVMDHYGKLGNAMELIKLRELATKVKGRIDIFGRDDESLDMYDYISKDGSYCDERYPSWLYDSPFSPNEDLIECGDEEFGELCVAFAEKFGLPPKHFPNEWPRLNIKLAFCRNYRQEAYDKFFKILLFKKFGRASNDLTPDDFAKNLERVQIYQRQILEESGELPRGTSPATGPSDWYFDHYGTLCSLVVVAFRLLPIDLQESAEIQGRLVNVLLAGFEDILTEDYSAGWQFVLGGGSKEEYMPDEEWESVIEQLDKPDSWSNGEGTLLMEKAWEVWSSMKQAKKEVNDIQNNDGVFSPENTIDVTEHVNTLLSLPCFSSASLSNLTDPEVRWAAPWDANCKVLQMYGVIAEIAAKLYSGKGNQVKAFELSERAIEYLSQRSYSSDCQHRVELTKLQLLKMHSLVELKRFREADEIVYEIVSLVEKERKAKDDQKLLEDELCEAKTLGKTIESRCGPVPHRVPVEDITFGGWWIFDASVDDTLKNAVPRNGYPSIDLWHSGDSSTYPDIEQLRLFIGEQIDISGLHDLFPSLKKLVIDDSKEDRRVYYNLEELKKYSLTLEYLELNLSGQWMAEGEDVLEPLSSLTKLKELRIERRRDGQCGELKHLEKLTNLERLFYWGSNRTDLLPDWDGSKKKNKTKGMPPEYVLDLTGLKKLTSITFVETEFCTPAELGNYTQALVLPPNVENVVCVDIYHSKWSKGLVNKIRDKHANFMHRDYFSEERRGKTKQMWNEIDEKCGEWISASN